MEWDEGGGDVGKKTVIKVHHPQKALEMTFGRRLGESANGVHATGEGPYALVTNRVPEEVERGHAEKALVLVDEKTIVT